LRCTSDEQGADGESRDAAFFQLHAVLPV
jgi:hypothetical protein